MKKHYPLFIIFLLYSLTSNCQGIYKLWGITQVSGDENIGSIYNTTGNGDNFQLRHQFSTTNPGASPQATSMVEYNGKYYGSTTAGGNNGCGLIFEWEPVTNVYHKKFVFNSNEGSGPIGSMIQYSGKFYGITESGGAAGDGVLFEWDPSTNVYAKKFEFSVLDNNGYWPKGSLVLNGGKIYGMTSRGGLHDHGVIFEFVPATNQFTKKIDFNGTNGNEPFGSLALSGTKFYGMTVYGGINGRGVIFEWDLLSNVLSKKLDFDGNNGSNPYGSLCLLNGKFYGLTQRGNANDNGVLFEWNPNTNVYTKKYEFNTGSGNWPGASLVLKTGKFYGMTTRGGSNDAGVVFEWDPSLNIYQKKFDMGGTNGKYPNGNLVLSGTRFYGMTTMGGTSDDGVIFEWDPSTNIYSKKIDLNDNSKGIYPTGNLVAKGSKWYGVTNDGGNNDAGVIFEWDQSTNVYTKKADLNLVNGSKPFASMELCNGKFYGTCGEGGNNNEGVLFEWDPSSNIYTKKIDLSWENGRKAYGSMVLHNGKLYGMTYEGGDNGGGVIYEYDPAGNTFLKKYSFNAPTGFRPTGEMVLVNGKFYGVTYKGGSNNAGVIFEWDPVTSIYTKKYDMVAANGSLPAGSLSLANGKLYGQTSAGGTGNWGVIFQWDPVTNVYAKKYDFTSSIDGNRPYSTMVYNSGKFYGTTKYGGANFLGVLFQWDPVNNVYVKKKDLSGTTNGSFPGVMSDVVKMAAPVAKGFINSCTILPAVTINNSNNNTWVPVIDNNGDAVAEIKANGNNLGLVTASMYNNTGNVREDGFKRLYLDRNITLTPTLQPTSPIEVRLYIRNSEYLAMKNSTNSVGQSSNINNISDLGVFRNADSCSATVVRTISPLTSVAAVWESDHVIATTTGSLGSFYFFSMVQGGPLAATSLEFNGRLVNNNGELNWRTRDEVNIASFELERSTNGTVYTKITNSKPTNEPGVHYYDHTDNDLLSLGSSTIYYRLRQNDLDGKFIYSRVIRFEQKPVSVITLYPNPVITEAFVSMSTNKNGNVEVRLIDNTGRVMQKMRWALSVGNNLVKFDVSALASGVYYIDMKGENINERKRFVKQ